MSKADEFLFEEFTQISKESGFCLWESNNMIIADSTPIVNINNITMRQFIDFLIFPKKGESKSIGSTINSMASTVFYNIFNKHKKLEINKVTKVNIFDAIYSGKQKEQRIQVALNSIILMTYRNGMNSIHNNSTGERFNTDCGWGCTIRSVQMMFAKAIMELKKMRFSKENNKDPEYMNILAFREEIIPLFADNHMPIPLVLKLKDFDWIFETIKKLYFNKQKKPLDLRNEVNEQNSFEIKGPFSINTICLFTKSVGKWGTVMVIIQALINIANKAYADIKLVHFGNGVITELEVFQTFGEEILCTCGNPFQLLQEDEDDNNDIAGVNESQCDACSSLNNNNEEGNKMKYNNKAFRFKHQGIIFVTVRLGLKYLEKGYIEDVKNIFKMQSNIGFIGGKDDRAFYFIGHSNDHFICLDPHLNQDVIDIANKDFSTYKVKDLYMIKPSEISPEITFALLITKAEDLIKSLLSLKAIKKEFIFIK